MPTITVHCLGSIELLTAHTNAMPIDTNNQPYQREGGWIKRDSALFFTQLSPNSGGKIEKLLSREISWADLFL